MSSVNPFVNFAVIGISNVRFTSSKQYSVNTAVGLKIDFIGLQTTYYHADTS